MRRFSPHPEDTSELKPYRYSEYFGDEGAESRSMDLHDQAYASYPYPSASVPRYASPGRTGKGGGYGPPHAAPFAAPPDYSGLKTTIMLRNLPANLRESGLKSFLFNMGFEGKYDALHLPEDFRSGCNRGYAFINFINHQYYRAAEEKLHGKRLPGRSEKMTAVVPAHVQGKEALERLPGRKKARTRGDDEDTHRPDVVELSSGDDEPQPGRASASTPEAKRVPTPTSFPPEWKALIEKGLVAVAKAPR